LNPLFFEINYSKSIFVKQSKNKFNVHAIIYIEETDHDGIDLPLYLAEAGHETSSEINFVLLALHPRTALRLALHPPSNGKVRHPQYQVMDQNT